MKREQRLVDLKIEQSGKPTSEKMNSHGSVSDLPADIVSVNRVLIRLLQICENESSSLESKSLLHIYGCGTWFILICNLLDYYLQFHKKCNISNSGEQKYISQILQLIFMSS